MANVTQIAHKTKQPYGGYLPMKYFEKEVFDDGITLYETENIHSSLVGIAVDYLTRFVMGDSVDNAFRISSMGAYNVGMLDKASALKSNITGLDDISISSACKLAGFDVCYRASKSSYRPVEQINPDACTIENIRTMVLRSITFWDNYGPIVWSGPTFEGGYTDTVKTGDGDYLTNDTLWDFKVSKTTPNTKHTLQLLMYYIMGIHSFHDHYQTVQYLGFFNPRLNTVYRCSVDCVSAETIDEIENNVICYGVSLNTKLEVKTNQVKQSQSDKIKTYTVSDICNATGVKKSKVYKDIRDGYLDVHKIGNKYCILEEDYLPYIKKIKTQQKIAIGLLIATIIGMTAFFAFVFHNVL